MSGVQTRILEIAIPDISLTTAQIDAINEVVNYAAQAATSKNPNPVTVIITVVDN